MRLYHSKLGNLYTDLYPRTNVFVDRLVYERFVTLYFQTKIIHPTDYSIGTRVRVGSSGLVRFSK